MPGPTKTPTKVLELRGSWRANDPNRRGEPEGPAGIPDPPVTLTGEAKKHWDDLVPMLDGMNVLTRIDGKSLARYCKLQAEFSTLLDLIDRDGFTYEAEASNGAVLIRPNPAFDQHLKVASALLRLEQEFGMTPSARSRINVPAASDNSDPASKYISGAA